MIKGAKIQLEQMNEQMQFATAVGVNWRYTFVCIYGSHE
jgi:hypothetical protein